MTRCYKEPTTYLNPTYLVNKSPPSARPPPLTRHSPLFPTQLQRSLQCPGVVGEGGGASEVAEEEEVVVEITEATRTLITRLPTNSQARPLQGRSTRAPSTQTCHLGSGRAAPCTSGGVEGPFSAMSPPLVRGKMFTPPSLPINETVTSSVL